MADARQRPAEAGEKPWDLNFEGRADKDLGRLDKKLRQRVLDAVDDLAENPEENSNLRKLKGRSEHRLRVGEWRVLLRLERERRSIAVLRVLPRGSAYKR